MSVSELERELLETKAQERLLCEKCTELQIKRISR